MSQCPLCEGCGSVTHIPSMAERTCPACGGNGVQDDPCPDCAKLRAELDRLREMLAEAEQTTGARTVRVQMLTSDGKPTLIITAVKSEQEIADLAAQTLNALLLTAGALHDATLVAELDRLRAALGPAIIDLDHIALESNSLDQAQEWAMQAARRARAALEAQDA